MTDKGARKARLVPGGEPGLGQDSGQDDRRRLEEATDLLSIIRSCQAFAPTGWEAEFLENLEWNIDRYGDEARVSGKQIFCLREMRDKAIAA